MKNWIWLAVLAALVTACVPAIPGGTAWGPGAFDSNGERIYFTATSERGTSIINTGGPATGMMTGGSLACASCHGPNGRGGRHVMHMQAMDAPDIRWMALAGEGEHEGDEHGDVEYTLDIFRMAVIEGKHPDGELLHVDMPRWRISDEDLADLAEYLKTLP